MRIYVATFTSGNGHGSQKICLTLAKAKAWLRNKFDNDCDSRYFGNKDQAFYEWCSYGAWTGKITSFIVPQKENK
jgi:hypothetical protein